MACAQGDQGDLRRAIEAEGHTDGADAAIDIELQAAKLEPSMDILSAHRGQNQSAEQGQANLTAMGVTAHHQINGLAGRISQQMVGVVRGMAQQDDGFIGLIAYRLGDSRLEVRMARERIVNPCQPDSAADALNRQAGISEHSDAVGFKRGRDLTCADTEVVIAEHGIELPALKPGEDVGALPGCADERIYWNAACG